MKEVILDTNVLLDGINLSQFSKVFLPITVVEELDKIKHKSEGELNYKARRAIRQIKESDNIEYKLDCSYSLPIWLDCNSPDNKILGFAKEIVTVNPDVILLSNDYNLIVKSQALGLPCKMFECENKNIEKYTGCHIIEMTENELANWYNDKIKTNLWNLNINEYLLLSINNEIVDKYRWTLTGFKGIAKKDYKSMMFGNLKPKDIYQELCIDSLHNNQFTAITGKPGSGKSLISLMYVMWALQNQKYDSCVIMYNPTKVRGAVDMGYYSGNSVEKGMQQFIGNMLITKFGDKSIVNTLISQEKIRLIPMADSRGMEVSDNQILYITECQNTTPDLLKICLSRCSKDAKIIIEGDPYQQVDKVDYVGKNNGLLKAIEIFKNEDIFGCVHLPNVWRSRIADLADKM